LSTLTDVKRDTDLARLREQNNALEISNKALQFSVETLQESFADVVLKLDDIGWRPLGQEVDATEIPLSTIKEVSQTTRGLMTINPLIKRGVAVRTSYIHGPGVEFIGLDEKHALLTNKTNQKFFFSSQAHEENEACLATDGNLFVLSWCRRRLRRSARKTSSPVCP
jgi:hypothetical protein